MKLILSHYLASLKERDELDAILPDLLSEMGFEIITRPQRGVSQAGVDVAAVGPDPDSEDARTLFLFTIKSGNLSRKHWDDGPQAVRPSMNEIIDDYIPHRIPDQYKDLPIAICVCMGGSMEENVRSKWTGFVANASTDQLAFREWNGDRLAGFLLSGVLRQEFLDGEHRSSFQKAVAMLDQPDVAYQHFSTLVSALLTDIDDPRVGTRRLRQAYICLWVMFVWARDIDNLEAPYRASELLLVRSWPECDQSRLGKNKLSEDRYLVFHHIFKLHIIIAETLIFEKIAPFAGKEMALSLAVNSRTPVDVGLSLFDLMGRISMHGIWMHQMFLTAPESELGIASRKRRDEALNLAIQIINSNLALLSPIKDDHAIEIALLMRLAGLCERVHNVRGYIVALCQRVCYCLQTRFRYPKASTDYRELLWYDKDRSDEAFDDHTCASVLYPLLVTWLVWLGEQEQHKRFKKVLADTLANTTHQIWLPDEDTDRLIWLGNIDHGLSVPGIPITDEPEVLDRILSKACEDHNAINTISVMNTSLMPVFLAALRHHRMPLPPHLWAIPSPDHEPENSAASEASPEGALVGSRAAPSGS